MNTGGDSFRYIDPNSGVEKVPPQIRRVSPSILEIRGGGGWLAFFGLPFLAAGIFMLLGAFGVVDVENSDSSDVSGIATMLFMGLVFTLTGAALALGRRWIIMNRGVGTVEKCWGLLVPMRRTSYNLSEFQYVSIRHVSGDSESKDTYPVTLTGNNVKAVQLTNSTIFNVAYEQSAYIAEFLQIKLEDMTTDNVRVIPPSNLTASVKDQLGAQPERREEAPQPLTMKSQVERLSDQLRITIPGRPFQLRRVIATLVSLVFALIVFSILSDVFNNPETPPIFKVTIVVFIVLFLIGLPLLALIRAIFSSRFGFTRLTITRAEIITGDKGMFRLKETRIPLSDVLDIDYQNTKSKQMAAIDAVTAQKVQRDPYKPPGSVISPGAAKALKWAAQFAPSSGITIKTRWGLRNFGTELPEEEVAYLAKIIREWIQRH